MSGFVRQRSPVGNWCRPAQPGLTDQDSLKRDHDDLQTWDCGNGSRSKKRPGTE
jgi:hypothetical protein